MYCVLLDIKNRAAPVCMIVSHFRATRGLNVEKKCFLSMGQRLTRRLDRLFAFGNGCDKKGTYLEFLSNEGLKKLSNFLEKYSLNMNFLDLIDLNLFGF